MQKWNGCVGKPKRKKTPNHRKDSALLLHGERKGDHTKTVYAGSIKAALNKMQTLPNLSRGQTNLLRLRQMTRADKPVGFVTRAYNPRLSDHFLPKQKRPVVLRTRESLVQMRKACVVKTKRKPFKYRKFVFCPKANWPSFHASVKDVPWHVQGSPRRGL